MRRVGGSLLVLAGLSAGLAGAAEMRHEAHAMPAARVEVRSKDGTVTIPFRVINNHVVMPIAIKGVRLEMVLDTGMPTDGVMLYRNPTVAGLELAAAEGMKAQIGGAGSEDKPVMANIVEGVTVDIDSLRLSDARAVIAPPLSAFAYHDGVIGASLFRNFVVSIDYDAGRITLYDPRRWTPPKGATSVPLTLEHNLPYADIAVFTPEGKRLEANVVLDLGAAHPVSLNLGTLDGLVAPAGAISTIVGQGLSGVVRGQVGRIAGLELGGVVLKDVIATFPIKEHQNPGGHRMGNGNLGNGLLQRFNVAFDYAQKRLLLTPNKGFDRPFEWAMSGLSLMPDDKGGLRVADVVEGSVAAQAGFAVDDVVTKVNGRDVTGADMFTLRQQFREAGAEFAITAVRDGKPIDATLRMKRLV